MSRVHLRVSSGPPPLAEGLLGDGFEISCVRPPGEPAGKAVDGAAARQRPLAYPRRLLGALVESRVREGLRHRLHRDVLGVELALDAALVLLVPDYPAPKVDEDLWDIYLHRADLVARAAQRRGVGQGVRARTADADELRGEDSS